MYNGIGLQTARGSGTNGYVQTNKFFVRAKTSKVMMDNNKGFAHDQGLAGISKKPNREILEHDRKRQIELQLVVLEDTLTEQGYTDAEIAEKLEETRRTLEVADAAADAGAVPVALSDKKVPDTQTHQIAATKEKQVEKFRAALGLDEEGKLPEEIVAERGKKKNSSDDENTEHDEGEIVATADECKHTKPRKRIVKDVKVDTHDGRCKKGRDKKKRHDQFSSDADPDFKAATESESDSDVAKRKRRSLKRSRKSMSDSSSSSSDDSDRPIKEARKRPGGRKKKHVQNRKGGRRKKRRAYESSDADSGSKHTSASESDSSIEEKRERKLPEQSKKNRNEDSDRFESDSDKEYQRRRGGKRPEIPRSHDSDGESDREDPLNRGMDKYTEAHLSRNIDNSDSSEGYQKKRGADRYPAAHKRHDSDSDSDHSGHFSSRKDENADARKRHDSDDESDEYDRRDHRKENVKQHERKSMDDSDEDERYSGMRSPRGQKTEPDYSKKISDDSRYHGSREERDMRNEEHARRRHDGADERGYKLHKEDYGQMDESRKRSRREEETGRRMYERDLVSSKRSRHDDSSYNGERRNEGSRHRDDRRRR